MCLPTLLILLAPAAHALALEPIPDKLVVLTFDDSSRSQVTIAAPLLKEHGFGETFCVTEGFDLPTNKRDYMTWDEIARLNGDGFEVGNHTRDRKAPTAGDPKGTIEQIEAINARRVAHGIPTTVTFAYPGNVLDKDVLPLLRERGIKFARRGGSPDYTYNEGRGFPYEPGLDRPLLPARDTSGRRWIITASVGCKRAWGNAPCPCTHADPRRPDCLTGESRNLRRWAPFYGGPDIQAARKRLAAVAFGGGC